MRYIENSIRGWVEVFSKKVFKMKRNILVIDDERNVHYALKMVLDKKYNVFLESGATEGMFCLANNEIDVVFLDVFEQGGS